MRYAARNGGISREQLLDVESLENRKLFSSGIDMDVPAPLPTISVHHGTIEVIGTRGNDNLGIQDGSTPAMLRFVASGHVLAELPRAAIRAMYFDMGDGNDSIHFQNRTIQDVPVTMLGGAGNDELYAQQNDQGLFSDGEAGHAPVIISGGDGDDYLMAGIGDATIYGGQGNDHIVGNGWLVTPIDGDYLPQAVYITLELDDPTMNPHPCPTNRSLEEVDPTIAPPPDAPRSALPRIEAQPVEQVFVPAPTPALLLPASHHDDALWA